MNNSMTKVEPNVVTYNLHCLSVMQQAELGKQVAAEE
jgi:hypothetical protein